jgi:serine/threonine protein kinase
MKFRPQLSLDLTSSSSSGEENSWNWGQTTYRKDGFSIGADFFRLEGRTISRGNLNPAKLALEEIIGRGNFSTVRQAQWQRTDDERVPVAVKQLGLAQCSKQRHRMLLKELRTLCMLRSEFLVTLHGAFLEEDTVYMVLEIMDRGSLYDYFEQLEEKQVSESFGASVAYQTLSGLAYLHANQMIHRDLKPANILLNSTGKVKLCDFGMAALNEDSMNTTIVGTTKFMAPERLRALPYGRSSDLWSLGLVLWQCATGQEPWSEVNSLVDLVVTVEETTMEDWLRDGMHDGLTEILEGCLQKDAGTSPFASASQVV